MIPLRLRRRSSLNPQPPKQPHLDNLLLHNCAQHTPAFENAASAPPARPLGGSDFSRPTPPARLVDGLSAFGMQPQAPTPATSSHPHAWPAKCPCVPSTTSCVPIGLRLPSSRGCRGTAATTSFWGAAPQRLPSTPHRLSCLARFRPATACLAARIAAELIPCQDSLPSSRPSPLTSGQLALHPPALVIPQGVMPSRLLPLCTTPAFLSFRVPV